MLAVTLPWFQASVCWNSVWSISRASTLIIPSNLADLSGLVASAMTVVKRTPPGEGGAVQPPLPGSR